MGDPKITDDLPSINEPPAPEGAGGAAPAAADPPTDRAPLPSDSELTAMTRVELNELALERGIEDAESLATKADVIAALKAS